MEIPFSEYGFNTDVPPVLKTAWNEQKRVVDLNKQSYVFITSLYSTPWRQRERFPNADRCTLKYYSNKWAEKRTKRSFHWLPNKNLMMGGTGAVVSSVFLSPRWNFR